MKVTVLSSMTVADVISTTLTVILYSVLSITLSPKSCSMIEVKGTFTSSVLVLVKVATILYSSPLPIQSLLSMMSVVAPSTVQCENEERVAHKERSDHCLTMVLGDTCLVTHTTRECHSKFQ